MRYRGSSRLQPRSRAGFGRRALWSHAHEHGRSGSSLVVVDERAGDFLLRLLIRSSSNSGAKFEEAEGALAAYEALGLISAEEAAWWRGRYAQEAVHADEEPLGPDSDVAARVLRLLDERIEHARSHPPDADRNRVPRLMRLVETFQRIGLLSAHDATPRLERLLTQFDSSLPDDAGGELPRCTASRLLRFVPGPPERHAGVRVTGFDLYDDGVVIRSRRVRLAGDESGAARRLPDEVESDEAAQRGSAQSFSLHDDLGTRYRFQGGGSGTHNEAFVDRVTTKTAWYAPAVPHDAHVLWATNGYRFEVTL
jgi:hypothetical protein